MKFFFKKKALKLLLWLGNKLFIDHTIWGETSENPDVIVFTNVENWEAKFRRSKKGLGVRTPIRGKYIRGKTF